MSPAQGTTTFAKIASRREKERREMQKCKVQETCACFLSQSLSPVLDSMSTRWALCARASHSQSYQRLCSQEDAAQLRLGLFQAGS